MEAERMKAIREAVEVFEQCQISYMSEDAPMNYATACKILLALANDVLEGKLVESKKETSDCECKECIEKNFPMIMKEERLVDINKTIEPLKEIRGRYETQSNATLYDFAVENRDKINKIIDRLNKEEGGR